MKKLAASYRPAEEVDTPYRKAQQEWDRRMGGATVHAANWRLIAFALAGLQFFSFAGLIYLGAQPKAIPHIVEIDKLGQPTYLGPLDRSALRDFKPSTASLHYHLRRFVTDTREISSDAAVLKRNWFDAYKLVTADGANQLNAYVKDSNPFEQLERQVRVSIQVNVIVQISQDTWQVDWTETTWDEHGNPTGTAVWRGNFHVLLRVPDAAEQLALNPLGLFIDELHWARLSTTDGRTTAP
jgi:type IV secretory pathway TrbF-like protein